MKAVVAALAAMVLLPGCGSNGHEITGTMTIIGNGGDLDWTDLAVGEECEGDGGYDDIAGGAQVQVSDESGTTIGTAQLETGEITDLYQGEIPTCTWRFTVPDVGDAKFYEVEVSHRGGIKYSQEEMEKSDWKVELSLSTS